MALHPAGRSNHKIKCDHEGRHMVSNNTQVEFKQFSVVIKDPKVCQ